MSLKHHWNKFKANKRLFWIVISIVVLLLIFLIWFVYLNITAAISEDLILKITPEDTSLSLFNDEEAIIDFTISASTGKFCSVECNYSFFDKNRSTDTGQFILDKQFLKSYKLKAPLYGEGQDIYNFEVKCSNVASKLCPSNAVRYKTAFIALNYNNSRTTAVAKQKSKVLLESDLNKLDNISRSLLIAEAQINFLKQVYLLDIQDELINLKSARISWNDRLEIFKKEFKDEHYGELYPEISDLKIDETQVNSLLDKVEERVSIYNGIIDRIGLLSSRHELIKDSAYLASPVAANATIKEINTAIIYANNKTNLYLIYPLIKHAEQSVSAMNTSALIAIKNAVTDFEKVKNYQYALMCKKGYCNNITMNNSVLSVDMSLLDERCTAIEKIKSDLLAANNISADGSKKFNLTFYRLNPEFIKLASLHKMLAQKSLKKLYFNEDVNVGNITTNNATLQALSESEYLQAVQFELSPRFDSFTAAYCSEPKEIPGFIKLEVGKTAVPEIKTDPQIITYVADNPKRCCSFTCTDCCIYGECQKENYPIIFIHGHSFNKGDSPEYSLNAFNSIQKFLSEEYINGGVITTSYSDFRYGELGMQNRSIMMSGTYYQDVYQKGGIYTLVSIKSENIETYSIRLKELIDVLKYRTGKDKVEIVAHSMGGLVARRYLQIFGEGSVDKIVLIAAPNKGIESSTSSLCPVLGAAKECEDMQIDSLFMNKVNDPRNDPKSVKVYTIIGRGCDMKGKDGDGVVTVDSSRLDFAENFLVNGSCTSFSGTDLHSDLLEPSKHPEVAEKIKDIIR